MSEDEGYAPAAQMLICFIFPASVQKNADSDDRRHFVKEKPKNVLTNDGIAVVTDVFRRWETREKVSRVVTLGEVRGADYNVSPSLFVETNDKASHRSLSQILADLENARSRREQADRELSKLLARLQL